MLSLLLVSARKLKHRHRVFVWWFWLAAPISCFFSLAEDCWEEVTRVSYPWSLETMYRRIHTVKAICSISDHRKFIVRTTNTFSYILFLCEVSMRQ